MPETNVSYSVIKIDWPFGARPPELYCPRSGKLVLATEDEVEQPASPYVTFIYLEEIGEFIYLRDDLAERLEQAREALLEDGVDEDDLPSDMELLQERTTLGTAPVIFEITTSGMACGPVSSTITVGFDLWSEADETEN